ncbi:MAG: HIT domain-containing protein [Ignavibacteriales bacterium]|nr:MAG: HIT domain-containing protein [Ignavibacteriales bacterium]
MPAEIVFENDSILSFLDIRPVNHGHTLVIPKLHYENFLSVPIDEIKELTTTTQSIAEALKKSLKADGFNLIVNHGAAAGQTIFHFHFHIIPRYFNDFKFKPVFKSYEGDTMKSFADKIRTELNI